MAYNDKVKLPFQVVPDAKLIGDMYGVSGYPTFVLIDEQGIIEKIVNGYKKEFFKSLEGI